MLRKTKKKQAAGVFLKEKVKISIIDYDVSKFQEKEVKSVEECFPFKDKPTVTWVNIDGVHDFQIIEKIGKHFNIHPLVLEDIVSTGQRPKMEDFEDYLFIAIKMLYQGHGNGDFESEQVSMIIGSNYVISFQEKEGDVFGVVRDRIRNAKGRIRKTGSDYLAYALMDAVVDNYFTILEGMGERIEEMEEELVSNPTPKILQAIHNLKSDTIFLRKSVWPLREVISGLQRTESKLISPSAGVYFRDIYDHTIQVIDTIETSRDMVSGMLDIYLSSVSNRMNEVMKVLTIIATIFIPLTFIAGIYGMNFDTGISKWNMPELHWRYGYAFVWGLMLMVVAGMLTYFKRKKWL
ncbi:MAG: magnesium/cobalt transporter CorA [Candidatus Omnitrophica bacterium]|nr:magnesium/cobalt transporter CorA [Candidatus Omnitrophota bacterium]MDD5429513.1 magnesium/cobalt transporter CorA [Candidatus Omnitrophota bacterium]